MKQTPNFGQVNATVSEVFEATITGSDPIAQSEVIDMRGWKIGSFDWPDDWTGLGEVQFLHSTESVGPFKPLRKDGMPLVSEQFVPGAPTTVDDNSNVYCGLCFLKIQAGTIATPAVQAVDRVIKINRISC